jgi:hypothetical protein
MEVAKADGSLRLRRVASGGFLLEEKEDDAASDSESCLDEAIEFVFEESRSTAENSSSEGVGEGLWYCLCFRDFFEGMSEVDFEGSSRFRFWDRRGAILCT